MVIESITVLENKVEFIVRFNELYAIKEIIVHYRSFAKLNKRTIDNIEYNQITKLDDIDRGLRASLENIYHVHKILSQLVTEINIFLRDIQDNNCVD